MPSPESPFTRVLVAVDGSDQSLHAARTAARLGRALGVPLTVLTVFHEPSAAVGEPQFSAALTHALDEARRIVEAARQAILEAGGPEPETTWLGGDPAETILSTARTGGYDLVVLGTRGRGRFQAALLGSVSAAVAARAGRPVLVVGREH